MTHSLFTMALDVTEIIFNDKQLNQNMLALVSKEINDLVRKRAMLFVDLHWRHEVDLWDIADSILTSVDRYDGITIYYDEVEWYIDVIGWPPNAIDL